jgi:magnesium transporter
MHDNYNLEELLQLVEQKQFRRLRTLLDDMNWVDIAEFLDELGPEDTILVFRLLPKETAAEVFTELEDTDDQERLINALSDQELREVLDELYLDDTVDLIEDMPANLVDRILRNTDRSTRSQINQLLNYPKDSAGSIMTTEFVYLHPDATVEESFNRIRKVGLDKETVYTCYVTENRILLGVVTVRRLLLSPYETRIRDIMETNVLSVNTHEDKEDVAQMFSKYDLSAVPVVDGDDRLVGIITFDDAMDVMEEEATEDIEKMAAILPTDKPYFQTGVVETWKHRIPWLLLLMISATFTGMILGFFEEALAANAALTLFIPMLMDTGGNSGSQASVTVIRAMSLGDIEFSDVFQVVWKEARVGMLCAATLGIVVFFKVIIIDQKSILMAFVVALTIFATIVIAKLVGCLLPMLAKRLGFDPAVMASPFITTVVDALSLVIYFLIATQVMSIT